MSVVEAPLGAIEQIIKHDHEVQEERGRRRHRWGPIPFSEQQENQTTIKRESDGAAASAPRKRRRSRWDTAPATNPSTNAPSDIKPTIDNASDDSKALMLFPGEIVLSNGIKVVLPPALTGRHPSGDPQVIQLHRELVEIDRKLRTGLLELPPEHERSPSPPPIYDANGIRQNTREVRMKEKITKQRNYIIEELIKRDSTYQPPADFKPEKKSRKLFIPYKQYPDYNFIGLIIGPRGSTHKKMQQETNTVIAIRGKGSVKEGARGPDIDEDLHVLITGDNQEDVDKAASMVERLLQPMDEEMNEHKQKQLRELAMINGTLKEDINYCYLCGETGHRQVDCPKKALDIYQLPDAIQAKVDEQYARDVARMNPGEAGREDAEFKSFLAELGGTDPRAGLGFGSTIGGGTASAPPNTDYKLWIGNIPPTMDSNTLRAMFEPYGTITFAEVKMDGTTGASRNFGFVHYPEESQGLAAINALNGRILEHGKSLIVRKKEDRTAAGGSTIRSSSQNANTVRLGDRPTDDTPPECKIYIGNIPPHTDDFLLRKEFEKFGPITSVRLIYDKDTRQPKGYGFVSYANAASAMNAIASMNGYQGFDPMLRPIVVRPSNTNTNDGGGGPGAGRLQSHQNQMRNINVPTYNVNNNNNNGNSNNNSNIGMHYPPLPLPPQQQQQQQYPLASAIPVNNPNYINHPPPHYGVQTYGYEQHYDPYAVQGYGAAPDNAYASYNYNQAVPMAPPSVSYSAVPPPPTMWNQGGYMAPPSALGAEYYAMNPPPPFAAPLSSMGNVAGQDGDDNDDDDVPPPPPPPPESTNQIFDDQFAAPPPPQQPQNHHYAEEEMPPPPPPPGEQQQQQQQQQQQIDEYERFMAEMKLP